MTTPVLDPQAQDADRLNWDSLVAEGIDARRTRDGAQWTLGGAGRHDGRLALPRLPKEPAPMTGAP